MKKPIVKGFADRARELCDAKHLQDQLQNIEDIFLVNLYGRRKVKEYIWKRKVKKRIKQLKNAEETSTYHIGKEIVRIIQNNGNETSFSNAIETNMKDQRYKIKESIVDSR